MIQIAAANGWRHFQLPEGEVWLAGQVIEDGRTLDWAASAQSLVRLPRSADALVEGIARIGGQFAAVLRRTGQVVALTDRVASIPLTVAQTAQGPVVTERAGLLARRLGLSVADLDPDGLLAFTMSGFTTGRNTLYRGFETLLPGTAYIFDGGQATRRRYAVYRSWRVRSSTTALSEVLTQTFERLSKDLAGRPIAVPLSGGLDSRLVVAGLHEFGVRDVLCFSYGLPGNFEAETSRAIAHKLGYRWTFVPYTPSAQRRVFGSQDHKDYLAFADSLISTPFEQDYLAVRTLLDSKWLPADAVVVNGQSGDFITGGHVPSDLASPLKGTSPEQRMTRVVERLMAKHYSLWGQLHTPASIAAISRQIRDHLADAGLDEVPEDAPHGAYELSEFDNRQSKYVLGGQRVYDYFGLGWRLPLWEHEFIAFWEGVPVAQKLGQSLYRETLHQMNWGDVWRSIPVNAKTIRPQWVRPLRTMTKLACAPFGKAQWRDLEKRLFFYFTEPLGLPGAWPYHRFLRDGRGFRNIVSWLTEAYLADKGLTYRGELIGGG